jgi:uncharacterized membrane protein YoaK (UPF0700 family)
MQKSFNPIVDPNMKRLASDAVDLPAVALPFVLSLIAGSTDTIGFLSLNGLFTAHITGNLVVLAAHVINGVPAILSYVLAVPLFMLVLLLTRLFASWLERAGTATLRPLLLLQLLLLIIFLLCCVIRGQGSDANSGIAIIAGMFGVAAMAVQTALVQISLTKSPSTAVMTTNITHFTLALGEVLAGGNEAVVASARQRVIHIFPVIVGFTLGCALGAAGQAAYGSWSVSLPVGLALVAVAISSRSLRVASGSR